MLTKYHALRNDYFVTSVGPGDAGWTAEAIGRLCHRREGWGSDGLLLLSQVENRWHCRIYNADGSEAKKSGNGVRIAAKYLRDSGQIAGPDLELWTKGGVVRCWVQARCDGELVGATLGIPSFASLDVPVEGPPRETVNEVLRLDDREIHCTMLTLGNPHCVHFSEAISEEKTNLLGPRLESHASFPRKTNVQFGKVIRRNVVEAEIWERGSGRTLSSGTSAAAIVCAGNRLGLLDRTCEVRMPGGSLRVHLDDDFEVEISGPVHRIGAIEILP